MRLCLLALALWASAARAEFSFEWDAPSSCPRPAPLELQGDGRAIVILGEKNSRWEVTVLFVEPTPGMRRVEATNCEEATQAALLLLKLGRQNTPAPVPTPPVVEVPPPVVVKAPALKWRFSAAAGAALDIGSLPLAEPRFALNFLLTRGLFAAAVDFRVGVPMALNDRVQAQRLIEAQLAGCVVGRLDKLMGGPCLALSGGRWRGFTSTLTAEVTMFAAEAQLRGVLRLVGGLELGALTGLRLNILRPEPFTAEGIVFSTPLLASQFQLTLGWGW